MPTTSGPTQMDYAKAGDASDSEGWNGRPALARAIRVSLWVLPLVGSLLFGFWASHTYPPERLGMNRWLWWISLAVVATVLTRILEKLTRRLTPLAMLLRLSLIFPDQAPSRFSSALRSGTTTKTKKRLKAIREGGGALEGDDSVAEQMLDLIAMLSKHDKMTRGHAERVRGYTDLLAEELGIEGQDAGRLRWGALLHDMGKLSVPPEVLNKAGRPDEEEWQLIKGHPAAAIPHLEPIADWLGEWRHAADGHHERWDGNGYPLGLAGKDIPLSARIVAVADAYDVMTSTRSYKKALPPEVARQEIADNAGSQFDPEVARAFLNIGLGDLRRATGPLAWIASLPGIRNVPIGTTITPVVAPVVTQVGSTAAAIVVATAGVVGGAQPATEPELAFATPVEIIEANDVTASEEDPQIAGSVIATGDGPLTITVVRAPEHGELNDIVVLDDPTAGQTSFDYNYDPDPGFTGTDSVVLAICDPASDCAEETIEITITAVENRPLSPNQTASVDEDGTVVLSLPDEAISAEEGGTAVNGAFELLGGSVVTQVGGASAGLLQASDPDGDALDLFVDQDSVANGAAEVVGRSIVFTHDGSETTTAVVRYAVSDRNQSSIPGTITLTVAPRNDDPIAADDEVSVAGSASSLIAGRELTGNDTDVDSETLTVIGASGAAHGTLSVTGGSVRYVHDGSSASTDSFTYTVADGSGGTATATVEVTIVPAASTTTTTTSAPAVLTTTTTAAPTTTTSTTTIPPNLPPAATSTQPFSISEGSPAGSPVGAISATDPEGGALTFAITSNPGPFVIDPATGIISLAPGATLDFETQSTYVLTVEITDADGSVITVTTTISVGDDNEAPLSSGPVAASAPENSSPAPVATAAATDPDGDTLIYALGVGPHPFQIDPGTGAITLLPGASTDHEAVDSYSLAATATDPGGLTATIPVIISITDVNEPPTSPASVTLDVDENTPALLLGSVASTDPDGDALTYAIDSGDPAGLLSISATGDISTTGPVNHETDPALGLSVSLTDPDGLVTLVPVVVNVNDVNEAPSNGIATMTVVEGGTQTLDISPSHADPDIGDSFSITLVTSPGSFSPGTTGVGTTLTYEHDGSETSADNITYVITDSAGNTATGVVKVAITPFDDPPVPTANPIVITLMEHEPNGPTGEFVTVTDPDNSSHTFTATGTPVSYMHLDPATGEIVVDDSALLDLEGGFTSGSIGVVNVSDGTNTVPVTVQVILTPVNEPPVFETNYMIPVPENSPVSTPANSSTVATDPEGGITFTMSPATSASFPFTINPTSGKIRTTGPVDFEAHANYPATITATDNGSPALVATDSVTIAITDVPENPVTAPATFTISEAQTGAYALGTLLWMDEDSTNHTIAIIGGNTDHDGDGTLPFTIDPTSTFLSTTLRLSDADDVTFGNDFTLQVEVTDDSGLSATTTITVNVTPRYTQSALSGTLIFNEVLWADRGNGANPINNEFIEVYNASNSAIDISGFVLSDTDVPNGEFEAESFVHEVPAGTTPLPAGSYAVLWTGTFTAPGELRALDAFDEAHAGSAPALGKTDDLYLFDASEKLVAYMAWGYDGGGSPSIDDVDEIGFRPPASFGLWDNDTVAERRLGTGPIVQQQSISLARNGDQAASTKAGCWEITGDLGTNRATCTHSPKPTFDLEDLWPRTSSAGVNNNLPLYVDNLVISEYASNTSSPATGEFIEIFNPTSVAKDLGDYQLQVITGPGTTNINLQLNAQTLLPGQYYLLTNTGNTALPVAADQTYSSFSLEHRTGLRLYDIIQMGAVDQVGNAQSYDFPAGGAVAPNANPYREQDGVTATETYTGFNISNQRMSFGTGSCVDGTSPIENNRTDFIRNFFPEPQNTTTIEPCDMVPQANPSPASGIVISEFRPNGWNNGSDDTLTVFNAGTSNINIIDYNLMTWNEATSDINGNGLPDPSEFVAIYEYGNATLEAGERFRIVHSGANAATLTNNDDIFNIAILDGRFSVAVYQLRDAAGNVVDEVSMGPDASHPTKPLPPSDRFQTRSWVRNHNGCQDTGVNLDDFTYAFYALELGSLDAPTPCP